MINIDKYTLRPLLEVEASNFTELFKNKNGLYLCNYPTDEWYSRNEFIRKNNYGIEKKVAFFNLLNNEALWISPTGDYEIRRRSIGFTEGRVIHLGTGLFKGKIAQVYQAYKVLNRLFSCRKSFDFILVYNFSFIQILALVFCKYVLLKKIYVDFEDDYNLLSRNIFKKFIFEKLVARLPDAVICVVSDMCKYFHCKTYVFNGFIDLSYTKELSFELEEGMVFLYSSTLDEIRGADLIPILASNLRSRLAKFQIIVTGNGPLTKLYQDLHIPEVSYVGFLETREFQNLLQTVDACLVLQKPDHIFSKGSFPSKIEYYSKYKKKIFYLTLSYSNQL